MPYTWDVWGVVEECPLKMDVWDLLRSGQRGGRQRVCAQKERCTAEGGFLVSRAALAAPSYTRSRVTTIP